MSDNSSDRPEFGNIYLGDTYDTPENTPHALGDRLCCGGRWYFYWHNFNIFRITGNLGKAGKLTREDQIRLSTGNMRLVEACGGRIHLRGLDNLRAMRQQPAVLLGNHMSLLETALFHAFLRAHMDFTFVIKPSLMKIPFFRDIMVALDAIVISRDNPRQDLKTVLEEGKRRLDAGRSVIIFPQGTRSTDFDPEKFSSIGTKLAKSSGYPILPFALKTDFLQNGRYLRDLGPIKRDADVWFEFAPARPVTGSGREQQQEVVDFIADRLARWKKGDADRAASGRSF